MLRAARLVLVLGLVCTLLLGAQAARAQEPPDWWNYESTRDGHAYAVKVDMGLRRVFPLSGFPYVIVTGVAYASARGDGLPELNDLSRLDALSEALAAAVAYKTRSIYAGSAVREGQQRNYFYVSDPNGVEDVIAGVYAKLCRGCQVSTEIRADAAWSAYRDYLFPDEPTRQRYGLRAY
ncbi:DUF695 domain-containing protein [Herbaspirillum robiniae]|uniref:DUF695 domain-containing protein n=1 Tax=Herbaspirillum robiniae TaxID=2014887 RepID=A0A246WM87_9BURK|nr:DUF695 domain-containing protein [Herbaspirillum robiniae]OWY27476.1 hypothetical protein CEJ42_18055 [Herbaspirillum robiniae]